MTKADIIRELNAEYELARQKSQREAESRKERALSEHPELRAALDALSAAYVERARRALERMTPEQTQALTARVENLRAQRDKAFTKAGVSPDDFEPKYACPTCADTGWVGAPVQTHCGCFTQKLMERLYSQSGVVGAEDQTFESFREDVFDDDARIEELGGSQREYMRRVAKLCMKYAADFPKNERPNLLFFGSIGLGKTFLLNCVARAALDRGYTVLRLTAFRLLERMRQYHMSGADGETDLSLLTEADLLIIDDLGSEPMLENITIEYLFALLNERTAANLHTMVATNLFPSDLRARYGERVFSRLVDARKTMVIRFAGADLRLKKPVLK